MDEIDRLKFLSGLTEGLPLLGVSREHSKEFERAWQDLDYYITAKLSKMTSYVAALELICTCFNKDTVSGHFNMQRLGHLAKEYASKLEMDDSIDENLKRDLMDECRRMKL